MTEHLLVQVEAVTKRYGERAPVVALHEVSLAVERGEFVAIVGASGSGKSTLLNLIGTLDTPTAGSIRIAGVDAGSLAGNELADFRREQIGFVFQSFHLLPVLTALENVALPLLPYARDADLDARARALLDQVGLGDRKDHLPAALSGGEQQRVAIARALINQPALILADEPTGNLDSRTGRQIIELLRRVNRESGSTLIIVTHAETLAAEADRVIRLVDGRIAGA